MRIAEHALTPPVGAAVATTLETHTAGEPLRIYS